jgi:predicted  nucleic acid-binding Zn-ribbon protein
MSDCINGLEQEIERLINRGVELNHELKEAREIAKKYEDRYFSEKTNVETLVKEVRFLGGEMAHYKEAYENMRAFAEANGLNTQVSN